MTFSRTNFSAHFTAWPLSKSVPSNAKFKLFSFGKNISIWSLALSDIGTLFPDNKEEFKGISSVLLLKKVYTLILEKGYQINNVDSNIIAQAPKMMTYIPEMKKVSPVITS